MLTESQESERPPEVFSTASHGWSDCVIDPSLASGKPACINVLVDPAAAYPGRD